MAATAVKGSTGAPAHVEQFLPNRSKALMRAGSKEELVAAPPDVKAALGIHARHSVACLDPVVLSPSEEDGPVRRPSSSSIIPQDLSANFVSPAGEFPPHAQKLSEQRPPMLAIDMLHGSIVQRTPGSRKSVLAVWCPPARTGHVMSLCQGSVGAGCSKVVPFARSRLIRLRLICSPASERQGHRSFESASNIVRLLVLLALLPWHARLFCS
mmetsp:Transcript_52677/g.120132  ORF Transcript_52677/g.120132 Transcript_52677/m.120132 type:complete len:212 (-) Transcript_52677:334-969(-)